MVKAIPGVADAMVALTAEKKGRRHVAAFFTSFIAARNRPHRARRRFVRQLAGSRGAGSGTPRAAIGNPRQARHPRHFVDHRGRFRQGRRRQVDDRRQHRARAGGDRHEGRHLDADITGPSMPRLLGIRGRPQTVDGKILKPMENYGLKAMSMGFWLKSRRR